MNGIIIAIPNNWKHIIMCETMIHDLICNFTNYIFREFDKSRGCAIKKWENDSETSVDDWHGIYSMSYV
jgi:hypothetical protein